jgi:hypothetical protein
MAIKWDKTFKVGENVEVQCGWEKTRYGFRHLAILRGEGKRVETKACYYNRTWEAYEYASVIHAAIHKAFNEDLADQYIKEIDNTAHGRMSDTFKMVAGIAKLGEIFCSTTHDTNDWKARMLKAGLPGIDMPEDFDNLPEDEKQRRLDGAIAWLA